MTDAWDGRPANPERDGWHWLHHAEDLRPCPTPWDADHAAWCSGGMHSPRGVVDLGYRYLGPCHTPAEVAAREQAAWRAGRDAAAGVADGAACYVEDVAICARVARSIRALQPPADLAAAATGDAVAQEREACAKIAERRQVENERQAAIETVRSPYSQYPFAEKAEEAGEIAAAIRARGGSASA